MFLVLAFLTFVKSSIATELSTALEDIGVKTVVIDPGHGGKDPGAVGPTNLYEKDVALAVSLKFGNKIKEKYPNVKVIYTRETDKFVGLAERAKIANDAAADLFISIHANAASNRSAYGSESWVLGLHKSAAALEVAKRENNSILMEDNYETTYEDFDPNDPDAYIGLALRQSANLDQSLILASNIQDEFTNDLKRKNRGVKQAGFLVLYRTTMPAVLIELGFVSNYNEEKYLRSDDGREELASSIFKAFESYKNKVEGVNEDMLGGDPKGSPDVNPKEVDPKPELDPNKVIYKVQISTGSKQIECSPQNFNGLNDVNVYKDGNFYKYTSGEFDTFDDANAHKNKVREAGFESAFVVKFKNGERIK